MVSFFQLLQVKSDLKKLHDLIVSSTDDKTAQQLGTSSEVNLPHPYNFHLNHLKN
jgi:hypothetical protein